MFFEHFLSEVLDLLSGGTKNGRTSKTFTFRLAPRWELPGHQKGSL